MNSFDYANRLDLADRLSNSTDQSVHRSTIDLMSSTTVDSYLVGLIDQQAAAAEHRLGSLAIERQSNLCDADRSD